MLKGQRKFRITSLLLAIIMIALLVFPGGAYAEGEEAGGGEGGASVTDGAAPPSEELPAPQVTTVSAQSSNDGVAAGESEGEPAAPAGAEEGQQSNLDDGAAAGESEGEPAVPAGAEEAPLSNAAEGAGQDLSAVVVSLSEANAVLVDEEGNPIPLASQEAAEVLAATDPIGCPPGVLPGWMGGTGVGCTTAYNSIQEAINDVSVVEGWTVYVQAGTYNESVTLNKSISLIGEDAATTFIQPTSGAGVFVRADDTIIKNFTIITSSWGIDFDGNSGVLPEVARSGVDNTLVENVILKNNTQEGIFIGNGAKVTNLTVKDSQMTNNLNGIGVSGSSSSLDGLVISNSTLNGNRNHGLIIQASVPVGAVTILQSQLNGNTKNGLIVQTGAHVQSLYVENSQMNANSGVGLTVNAATVDTLELVPTTMDGNNEHGMLLFNASIGTLASSGSTFNNSAKWEGINIYNSNINQLFLYDGQISGNKGQGLSVQKSTFGEVGIYNNAIQNNNQSGLALAGTINDYLWVDGNIFYRNGWEDLDLGYWGGALNVIGQTRIYGGNLFSGGAGISIWIDPASNFDSTPMINYNMIAGPAGAIANLGDKTIDAEYNWWGCDGGIDSTGCRYVAGPEWGPSSNTDTDPWLTDPDGDGVWTSSDGSQGWGWNYYLPPYDNCPSVYNPGQKDSNGDGIGDACTPEPEPEPGPVVPPPAEGPGEIIPVASGELVGLSSEVPNTLQLSSGSMVAFNQVLAGYQAKVNEETEDALPQELSEGLTFVSAMTVALIKEGAELDELDAGTLTVSFPLPAGQGGANFAILYWDAAVGEWVELTGVEVVNGMVSVDTNLIGTFVLVVK